MPAGKSPEKKWEEEEKERERFAEDLEEVGESLPEYIRGIEGEDVGHVVRHDEEDHEAPPEEATNPLLHDPVDIDEEVHLVEEPESGAKKGTRRKEPRE